jgi:uncharacterized SAM-binding protein YcdF (DUF218 family)
MALARAWVSLLTGTCALTPMERAASSRAAGQFLARAGRTWWTRPVVNRLLAALGGIVAVLVALLLALSISGYLVFTGATADELQPADAIVVLGGEHDGREDYGLSLAQAGWAKTVVLSNPWNPGDQVMKRVCGTSGGGIEVICRRPDPPTTRGEAAFVRQLAKQRSWTKVIVVSWRYHLPRARLIFRQCFSDAPGATVMVPVPRRYQYSALDWEFVYAYQWGGIAKALVQGNCDDAA